MNLHKNITDGDLINKQFSVKNEKINTAGILLTHVPMRF